MNHCLLEVTVKVAPTIRYTQDNQTAIAEMDVVFAGLRPDDPPGIIKAIGWGNMAQELQNLAKIGQKYVLEGRLRMNMISREDGSKEKKAEFTVSKIHSVNESKNIEMPHKSNFEDKSVLKESIPQNNRINKNNSQEGNSVAWDSSPLIPDTDDIPF